MKITEIMSIFRDRLLLLERLLMYPFIWWTYKFENSKNYGNLMVNVSGSILDNHGVTWKEVPSFSKRDLLLVFLCYSMKHQNIFLE